MAAFKKTQTLIFSIFLFLVTTVATHAADATFSWTASDQTVSGYKIHYGTSSLSYDFEVDVPQPVAVNGTIVATVSGLQEGQTYYFAATAYLGTADSIIEESDYSDEVVYTVPGTATPQPPITADISLQGSEDTPLSGQLEADNSEGTSLTFTVVSQPGHGTIIVEDDTGSFTYTPAPNYSGDDSFSYTAANSAGTSNQAIVTIHLSPVNDAPVAKSTAFSVNEDGNYSGTSRPRISMEAISFIRSPPRHITGQQQSLQMALSPTLRVTISSAPTLLPSRSVTAAVLQIRLL